MPWKETTPLNERLKFIAACLEDDLDNFAALCRQFGISRKTGYKWLERFEQHGAAGLADRPHTPQRPPHRLPESLVDLLVATRKAHPTWGPKKLHAFLAERHTELELPAPSTIGEWLKRYGLIRPRKRRLRVPLYPHPRDPGLLPNDLWCVDFKGDFALGSGSRCYPLTITDAASRYLLRCEALTSTKEMPVRERFEQCFREFGLPTKIRSDNGSPFASTAPGGLTKLAVWWIKLGITPERTEPGHPEQNGRHERMHRTLKAEATTPPASDLSAQQRVFDRFRGEFNGERPHEALGQKPPARLYALSRREYPRELSEPEYGADMLVRRVARTGALRWSGHTLYLGSPVALEAVGFTVVGDNEWTVHYGPVLLGVARLRGNELKFKRELGSSHSPLSPVSPGSTDGDSAGLVEPEDGNKKERKQNPGK
jgi:putative transposase